MAASFPSAVLVAGSWNFLTNSSCESVIVHLTSEERFHGVQGVLIG
jgi:hypothetical protein